MGRDEERSVAPAEMFLEPLEGPQVEVVRRLVEKHQVGIGDDQAGECRPGLLAPGKCAGRLRPLIPGEPEARQRLVDALVEGVSAEDLETVLKLGIEDLLDPVSLLQLAQPGAEVEELGRGRSDGGPEVGRGHEGDVEVRLLGEQADGQAAFPAHVTEVRFVEPGRDPEQRGLARAVRADQPDPVAQGDRASIASRITKVPISRVTFSKRRIDISRASRTGRGQRPSSTGPPPGGLPRLPWCASSGRRSRAHRHPVGGRSSPAGSRSRRIARGPADRTPAGAGTTNRSGLPGRRSRSAGSAGRSVDRARRCAGRR